MSRVVYKYIIPFGGVSEVQTFEGVQWLHADMQNDTPTVWGLVDTDAKLVKKHLEVWGTGHPHDKHPIQHIGSMLDGVYVWHVFEVQP